MTIVREEITIPTTTYKKRWWHTTTVGFSSAYDDHHIVIECRNFWQVAINRFRGGVADYLDFCCRPGWKYVFFWEPIWDLVLRHTKYRNDEPKALGPIFTGYSGYRLTSLILGHRHWKAPHYTLYYPVVDEWWAKEYIAKVHNGDDWSYGGDRDPDHGQIQCPECNYKVLNYWNTESVKNHNMCLQCLVAKGHYNGISHHAPAPVTIDLE